jgi:hypothetical protein
VPHRRQTGTTTRDCFFGPWLSGKSAGWSLMVRSVRYLNRRLAGKLPAADILTGGWD